ncbi:AIPR family protein [Sphaerochaeta globosa]|uniref:Abortive phage infection protein n=1 Tax=Sphaerochaeta globosa (strain ATCC BAA-1886 / DSM 22777 / Buddy) TaxID=158189 RepID=F0RW25_SPHGB|nr:AIPR family protein [Sphaerochaeta globosa]ADY13311.1 Abortive phage infection protein [Sphaerochaeta globosa str. Buddy]
MISLADFRSDLIQNSKIESQENGQGDCAAFVERVMGLFGENGFWQDFQPCFFNKRFKNNAEIRFDGFATEEAEETLCVVIASYSGMDHVQTVTQTEILKSIEKASRFLQNALGPNKHEFRKENLEIGHPAYDLFTLANELFSKNEIQKIKFIFITDGLISDRLKSLELKTINDIPVAFDLIDIKYLYQVVILSGEREELDIDITRFDTSTQGFLCVEIPQNTDLFKCYLAVIPGATLSALYTEYGSKLLEGNVRSFLTTKKAVNKKIRETILQKPEYFFVYNNGIAVTSTGIDLKRTESGLFITSIRNLQIINGGQTTAILASTAFKDKANLAAVAVQMKLTVINNENKEQNAELIQQISRSSNSQNPVNNADFFSNHPFQQQIKQLSDLGDCEAPKVNNLVYRTRWFYERSNGEYSQKKMFCTIANAKKFEERNPKSQIITKTSLAKAYNLYYCHKPDVVSKGAMTNFCKFADEISTIWEKSENDKARFNPCFYRQIASIHILLAKTGIIVSSQNWYDGSYRANVVAYSVAWFFEQIEQKFGKDRVFNYHKIWDKQAVDNDLTEMFMSLTTFVYNYLINEKDGRTTTNVTQWCKKETCWANLKKMEYNFPGLIENYLIDKKIIKDEEKAERNNSKEISEINTQTSIFTYKLTDWKMLENYAYSQKNSISESEKNAIVAIIKMYEGKSGNPPKKVCDMALNAMQKAYEDGMQITK